MEITRANKVLTWLVLVACAILSLFYSIHRCDRYDNVIVDTVRTVRIDTLRDTLYGYISKPIPKYIYKIRTDTVYNGVGDTIVLKEEKKVYKDSLIQCEDTAIVTTVIHGINAELDSMSLELRKQNTIITNTVEVTRYKKKGGITHGVQIRCWLFPYRE